MHGESFWRKYLSSKEQLNAYDKIIFLGDYLDSFFIKDEEMHNNLMNIIQLKKDNPEKIVLLWGNHDLSYYNISFMCSGWRHTMHDIWHKVLNENKELFKLTHQEEVLIDGIKTKYLFSHAGISQLWLDKYKHLLDNDLPMSEQINKFVDTKEGRIALRDCIYNGNREGYGSPIWIRDHEWGVGSALYGYNQFVGHTPQKDIKVLTFKHGLQEANITILDKSRGKEAFVIDTEADSVAKSLQNSLNECQLAA